MTVPSCGAQPCRPSSTTCSNGWRLSDTFFIRTAAWIETEVYDVLPAISGKSREDVLESTAAHHAMVSWIPPCLIFIGRVKEVDK